MASDANPAPATSTGRVDPSARGVTIAAVVVALAAAASIALVRPFRLETVAVAAVGLVWTSAATWLARRQNALAFLCLATAAVIVVGDLSRSATSGRSFVGPGSLALDAATRVSIALLPALAAHLLLALPDGRVGSRLLTRLVVAMYAVSVAVGLVLLADRGRVLAWPIPALVVLPLATLPAARSRYRRSSATDRRRLQWFGWAITVVADVVLVTLAVTVLIDWPHHEKTIAIAISALIPLALVAGAMNRVVGRVDRLLTHTVSAAGLTVLIIGAYLLALVAFGRRPNDGERALLVLSMLAAAAASIAYQPTHSWLTERANRVVYGARVSPDEALRTWGSRLTRAIPLDELLLQLVEALRKSLVLNSAQVWTGSDGHLEVTVAVPHQTQQPLVIGRKELPVVARAGVSGGTWIGVWLPTLIEGDDPGAIVRVAPIAHGGELLGLIVCRRAAGQEAFSEEDDRVLTELARQVGLALHNVQLDTALQASLIELRATNEELRASRTRVVAAADDARRKLERNLHDGAQQHLVALAVKLRLAKDALVDDPADAEVMLDELRRDMQEAIAELRSLAHGIFPPLLASGGLAEALPATAARTPLTVSTDVSGVGRHAPELESAVYFCCSEALQNAGKHAGSDSSVVLHVWEDDGVLRWEVTDDGVGFLTTDGTGDGHGFVNMRDRMGSVGGSLDVISSPGRGTTVSGRIPL
jgi:signal transduction histidine kinase